MKKRFMALAFLSLLIIWNSGECYEISETSPPEDCLAMADFINPSIEKNKITMNRYRTLVNRLSERLKINKDNIMAACVSTKKMLAEEGINESCLNILEAVLVITNMGRSKQFTDYLTDYIIFRQNGAPHDKTVIFMSGSLYHGIEWDNQKDNQ